MRPLVQFRKRKDTGKWLYDFTYKDKRYRSGKYRTRAEALSAADLKIDQLMSANTVDKDITFNDYYIQWIEANGKYDLSYHRIKAYKYALKNFNKYFGKDKKLTDIKRLELQAFLQDYGATRTKGTVKSLYTCIRKALVDAVYDGYLNKDPTYDIKVSGKVPHQAPQDKFLTISDYLDLMDYFDKQTDESYIILYMMAVTGARYSDLIEMEFSDLEVSKTIIHLPGTKSHTSDRHISLSEGMIKHIKGKVLTLPKRNDGKLFKVHNETVQRCFHYARKQLNIDYHRTPYALRHTHGSYLLSKGLPIEYISKRLGHRNIEITMKIYIHLLKEHEQELDKDLHQIF